MKVFNYFCIGILWFEEKYMRKSSVYVTNWGAAPDSN
jgi:hypothetical protein